MAVLFSVFVLNCFVAYQATSTERTANAKTMASKIGVPKFCSKGTKKSSPWVEQLGIDVFSVCSLIKRRL